MQIKKIHTMNELIFFPFIVFPVKVNLLQVKRNFKLSRKNFV